MGPLAVGPGPSPDTWAGSLEPSPYGGMSLMRGEGVREAWHFKFIQLLHFRPRPSGQSPGRAL